MMHLHRASSYRHCSHELRLCGVGDTIFPHNIVDQFLQVLQLWQAQQFCGDMLRTGSGRAGSPATSLPFESYAANMCEVQKRTVNCTYAYFSSCAACGQFYIGQRLGNVCKLPHIGSPDCTCCSA